MDTYLPLINISVEDKSKFTQLASVLDREIILEDIKNLRKEWNISEFYRRNEYISFLKKASQMNMKTTFNSDVRRLRKKRRLDPVFDKVLKRAIVCNEVNGDDYITADVDLRFYPKDRDATDYDVQYVITITPNTELEDLLKSFQEFKTYVENPDSSKKYYSYYEANSYPISLNYDSKSEIRRDRVWYSMWRQEKSRRKGIYNWILCELNKSCSSPFLEPHEEQCNFCIFDINIIEQAVSRYKKFLKR